MLDKNWAYRILPAVTSHPLRRILTFFHWLFRVFVSAIDRFYWNNGFGRASGLAYMTLLSLVPVAAMGAIILTSIVVRGDEVSSISQFVVRQFLPQMQFLEPSENGISAREEGLPPIFAREKQVGEGEKATQVTINLQAFDQVLLEYLDEFQGALNHLNELVIVFIVITCLLLLNSIEYALNEIWQVYETRPFGHRLAIFCAIIVLAPVLAVSGYYSSNYLSGLRIGEYFPRSFLWLIPFLIDFSAFVALYYWVPKAPVKLFSACLGALSAAILFGAAKTVFAIYIMNFSSYQRIYETLAVIPIFLVWLYLAWTIVLFGVEISFQSQYLPRQGKVGKRTLLSIGDGRLVLAMQALILIARAFREGRALPNDLELCERLGCSTMVLKPILDTLKAIGIIERGEGRAMPLTLLRSPDRIMIQDLKGALISSVGPMHCTRELGRLFESMNFEDGRTSLSLEDLMTGINQI